MLKCHLIQIEEKCGCCLIASARYSSKIDSQVQQFLQLQDPVLQTESGIAFMKTFKDNHYVINLIIVNYERENPLFKKAVKLAITPMIRLLDSMEHVKSKVLSIGISVIMLNLGMYLGVPTIVIIGIRKRF